MSEREMNLNDWSQSIRDEVLFRAAEKVSDEGTHEHSSVSVTLEFVVRARTEGEGLELAYLSDVDGRTSTLVRRPF